MANPPEFWLFQPQLRLTMVQLVERAVAAEAAGFAGMAGMDHLAPPGAETMPMFESMTTNAWLAARTSDLRVGALVLCDGFRHPAVLAREAVTIDHASGGRFELGIGWGSVPTEFETFGFGWPNAGARFSRLKESLEIITSLWRGETIDYEGEYFTLRGAQQRPLPLHKIPIVIGGAGPRTMGLVAAYADWWNLHIGILDKYEEMRSRAGSARCSVQVQLALVPPNGDRAQIEETARRRFGPGPVVGTAPEHVEYLRGLVDQGFERVYVWFTDFAQPETLEEFGHTVLEEIWTS
ncbi:MAG TPA: LLM class flavin-dependent oxidoreductase [Acidimicrobiales bacterium]|jgi:alkanesulfonate monooxygenase SsuD/methylene tetrahydromethanopterin reductase-like flavin-dependent oxidoreductase (luciferase family)